MITLLGLIEESAQVDGQILSEVVIPMMNVSRRAAFGAEDPNDITNKAQLYINLSTKLKKIVASLWKLVK